MTDMNLDELFSLEEPQGLEPPVHSTKFFQSSLDFLASVHKRKTEELKEVLATQGWPDAKTYGEHAEAGAFIIALHSDYDLDFQIRCHAIMLDQAKKGEGKLSYLAFLTDRILCNKGLHQRFGTQYREAENGNFVPKALQDVDQVDQWRELVGLRETMADYLQRTNDGDFVPYRIIFEGYAEELEAKKENKILEFPKKQ